MIKTICGAKGFGKTKIIIDEANKDVAEASGNVVFITDTKRYMYDLVHKIRFIDTKDFEINSEESLISFIKGIIAGNSDTQYIFIDGAARIVNKSVDEMADFYSALEKMIGEYNLTLILTVSCEPEKLPAFIAKYSK